MGDHLFSIYAKLSGKQIFLTPQQVRNTRYTNLSEEIISYPQGYSLDDWVHIIFNVQCFIFSRNFCNKRIEENVVRLPSFSQNLVNYFCRKIDLLNIIKTVLLKSYQIPKQLSVDVLCNISSDTFCKILRKTPATEFFQ